MGLFLCALWGCSAPAPIPGVQIAAPVSLLELFPRARKTTEEGVEVSSQVKVVEVRVGERPEPVLFLHPTSEVIFPLRLERGAVLDTAIALVPEGWTEGGDGVTFYVAVRVQGEDLPTYLFSRHLYPQLMEAHRGWQPVSLDLTSYRGRDIELILGTHPGPEGDSSYDWAVWRDPLLYHPVLDAEWIAARRARQAGAR